MRDWRIRMKFVDPGQFSTMSDDELDHRILSLCLDHPERGELSIISQLMSMGIFLPRARIRASIIRVDAEGREGRRRRTIQRREYNVAGPHHLWHIDGNHKLIKFHIVIHGGMDGYSRACTFLRAADNNEAATAFHAFQEGFNRYGIPSRVRTDKGGENRDIGYFMIQNRGMDRGSIITGKSTHNQRIERFWREVSKEVTEYYRTLFYDIQEVRGIDFSHPLAIFVLHFLFLRRINFDLDRFRLSWNNHRMRTEQYRTPTQLLLLNRDISDSIPSQELELDGVEGDITAGDSGDEKDDIDQAELLPLKRPLSDRQYEIFSSIVSPFTLDDVDREALLELFIRALQACIRVVEQY